MNVSINNDDNNNSKNKFVPAAEVSKHFQDNDCWVIINDKVYDVTDFLENHPGGKRAIMIYAGKEASEEFNMLHNPNVLEKYLPKTAFIGYLKFECKM